MNQSMLVQGLRTNNVVPHRSRVNQSLIINSRKNSQEGERKNKDRDGSLEKLYQRLVATEANNDRSLPRIEDIDRSLSLPKVVDDEPIRIKNRLYTIKDRCPNKPTYAAPTELLLEEEIFMGGVEESKSRGRKHIHAKMVQSSLSIPSRETENSASTDKRSDVVPTVNTLKQKLQQKRASQVDENYQVKVSKIMPTYQGSKLTETFLMEQKSTESGSTKPKKSFRKV